MVRWAEFNAARRYNPNRSIKDFTDIYELNYERLPGYEHLSKKEYVKLMLRKLEEHRQEIVAERRKAGLGFATPEALRQIKLGATPRRTKTSTRTSHRPRVICTCPQRRAQTLEWYFSCYAWYKDSSRRYRLGELDVEFPPQMYKPSQTSLSLQ